MYHQSTIRVLIAHCVCVCVRAHVISFLTSLSISVVAVQFTLGIKLGRLCHLSPLPVQLCNSLGCQTGQGCKSRCNAMHLQNKSRSTQVGYSSRPVYKTNMQDSENHNSTTATTTQEPTKPIGQQARLLQQAALSQGYAKEIPDTSIVNHPIVDEIFVLDNF